MQYKKEEVRNAILEHAQKEFALKGFEGASIRSIAKSAGTTLGNVYNYFKSKEDIFRELVDDEYNRFIHFINHHNDIERPDYLWDTLDMKQCRDVLRDLIATMVIPVFTDKLVLLLEASKGTEYEDAKTKLVSCIEEHFIEHMERFDPQYTVSSFFPTLIARQFLDGMNIIFKENHNKEQQKNLLVEHVLFYFVGIMGLLGNP